jgi:hypothetical protein
MEAELHIALANTCGSNLERCSQVADNRFREYHQERDLETQQ